MVSISSHAYTHPPSDHCISTSGKADRCSASCIHVLAPARPRHHDSTGPAAALVPSEIREARSRFSMWPLSLSDTHRGHYSHPQGLACTPIAVASFLTRASLTHLFTLHSFLGRTLMMYSAPAELNLHVRVVGCRLATSAPATYYLFDLATIYNRLISQSNSSFWIDTGPKPATEAYDFQSYCTVVCACIVCDFYICQLLLWF